MHTGTMYILMQWLYQGLRSLLLYAEIQHVDYRERSIPTLLH